MLLSVEAVRFIVIVEFEYVMLVGELMVMFGRTVSTVKVTLVLLTLFAESFA